MDFNTLGLRAELLRAVTDQGYTVPTPVQAQSIPKILEGKDMLAGAQTGTGKTAGFTLPMLQRLLPNTQRHNKSKRPIRALILTPTRELAAQVEESVRIYGKHTPIVTTVIFGGVSFNPQFKALRLGIDVLVATPGRLLDHINQRTADLSNVEIFVLDEADRMLDMGFLPDIKRIIALLPQKRQNLMFSATYTEDIKRLADGILVNPEYVEVQRKSLDCDLVTQVVYPVDRERKRELLSHLVRSSDIKQGLVFTRTKHGANRLAEQLEKDGIATAAIHGNKSQPQRTKALADFKRGAVKVLVATDIAARGLDIDQLPHVINFELPTVPEDYVHRIGRTGRAGLLGDAISLVCVDELKLLAGIEKLLKKRLSKEIIPGFEPDPRVRAERIVLREGFNRSKSGGGGAQRSSGDRRPLGNSDFKRRTAKPSESRNGGGNNSGNSSGNGNASRPKPQQSTDGASTSPYKRQIEGKRRFGYKPEKAKV